MEPSYNNYVTHKLVPAVQALVTLRLFTHNSERGTLGQLKAEACPAENSLAVWTNFLGFLGGQTIRHRSSANARQEVLAPPPWKWYPSKVVSLGINLSRTMLKRRGQHCLIPWFSGVGGVLPAIDLNVWIELW